MHVYLKREGLVGIDLDLDKDAEVFRSKTDRVSIEFTEDQIKDIAKLVCLESFTGSVQQSDDTEADLEQTKKIEELEGQLEASRQAFGQLNEVFKTLSSYEKVKNKLRDSRGKPMVCVFYSGEHTAEITGVPPSSLSRWIALEEDALPHYRRKNSKANPMYEPEVVLAWVARAKKENRIDKQNTLPLVPPESGVAHV